MHGDFRFSPLENGLGFLLSSLEHLTAASSIAKTHTRLATKRTKWLPLKGLE
jgi:hypothetical protein